MDRAVILNRYAWEMCRLDTLKSMELSNEALELSEQINYESGKIDANLTMVQCFWLTGDYVQAIDKLDKLMSLVNETDYQKGKAEALNLFGSIYSSMNKLSEAENYFKQTLELRKAIGDGEGIVRSMNSLGDTLMKNLRYEDALEMFQSRKKSIMPTKRTKALFYTILPKLRFSSTDLKKVTRASPIA